MLGESLREVVAEGAEDGGGVASVLLPGQAEDGGGVASVGLRGEIDLDRVAFFPVGRDLQDGRAAEAAVGDQQFFDEAGFGGWSVDADQCGEAGELGPGGFFTGEEKRDQGWAGFDDSQAELAGEVVAECGCSEFGDGKAAGGDDEGFRLKLALGAVEVESCCSALDFEAVGVIDVLDFAGFTFGQEHFQDGLGGVVAEELAEGFFVEGDVVFLDQFDEVVGGVLGEG